MQWHIFKFWDSNHNHSSFICELDVRYHVKCFSCSPHEASTVGNWGLERFTLLKVTVSGCFRISVALSLSKVHSLISSMKVRVDWWRSRLGDGAELESNFSLHHRPKLLLCDLIIAMSRIQIPAALTPIPALLTVMQYHRNTRWQSCLFWTARSSSSRKLTPKIKWEAHIQPPPGGGMAEGAGQDWFLFLSPLQTSSLMNTIFPWYSLKKKVKPDWAEICKSVLSYPHKTSGIWSLLPETPTQHYF